MINGVGVRRRMWVADTGGDAPGILEQDPATGSSYRPAGEAADSIWGAWLPACGNLRQAWPPVRSKKPVFTYPGCHIPTGREISTAPKTGKGLLTRLGQGKAGM